MSKLLDVPETGESNRKGQRRSLRTSGGLFAGHMMKSHMTVIWRQMESYIKHEN